jgi:glyoxylase-like metal-dependent hydrolase (beta-lactamase superfamily II)
MPELADHGIARLRADNPSPYTLDGTNTWVLGRDPAWVVDPGPALDAHLDAVAAEVAARGGAGGIALTHDHEDHVEGVAALRERLGGPPVAAARFPGEVALEDGDAFGPLRALAIPGHADDHLAFVAGAAAFTGDAVLGQGSVFVASRLGEYLTALERLRGLGLAVLCPGHGPPVWDPEAKLGEYLAHRAERERMLLAALEAGARTEGELLDAAWPDAPPALRGAAGLTLRAHAAKLAEEGRLPDDVRLA